VQLCTCRKGDYRISHPLDEGDGRHMYVIYLSRDGMASPRGFSVGASAHGFLDNWSEA
jgi:hypothetical protein